MAQGEKRERKKRKEGGKKERNRNIEKKNLSGDFEIKRREGINRKNGK